jgi:hypothetical protein
MDRIVCPFYLKPPNQANANRDIPAKRGKKAEIKFLSNQPIKVMKLSNVLNKAVKGGAKEDPAPDCSVTQGCWS